MTWRRKWVIFAIFSLRAPGECVCTGDPHCHTFDAEKYNREQSYLFTSSCTHTLVRDNCFYPQNSFSFEVNANFNRVKPMLARSYVSSVDVKVGAKTVTLMEGPTASVGGGSSVQSYSDDDFDISVEPVTPEWLEFAKKEPTTIMTVSLANGVQVMWDGRRTVKVLLPKSQQFVDNVCGLCGNFDGNFTNDMAVGYHTSINTTSSEDSCEWKLVNQPFGEQACSVQELENSWYRSVDGDNYCEDECAPVNQTALQKKQKAIATTADKEIGSTKWSFASAHRTGKNTWKCNIFVAEMIEKAGASVPHRRWWKWSPIGAGEWGNPKSAILTKDPNWKLVKDPQPGDVASDGKHCGIVTGDKTTTSATKDKVVKNDWGFDPNDPKRQATAFWRYVGK